jgi:hypothetical protein
VDERSDWVSSKEEHVTVFTVQSTAEAMDAIAPEPLVETQFFAYFAPRLFIHGTAVEVDGRAYRVAIRAGNVKISESDQNEYAADGFIEVDGAKIGVVDPERKTEWSGGEWPPHWTVNIAVYPRRQFDSGVFYKNSRTNKLRYMKACAQSGYPGFIALYSNAFGDPDKPFAQPNPDAIRSAVLVPASALYGADGSELLPVAEQPNRYGPPLPVFKVPMSQCLLVSSPQDFESVVLSSIPDLIRSLRNES